MSTTGRAPLIVDGEYNRVSRQSADVDALRLAHQTPIDRKAARVMIANLERVTGVKVALTFTSIHGRGGKRVERESKPVLSYIAADGREVYRMRRERTGRVVTFVSLPKRDGTVTPTGGWGLRVGILLHEFTHAAMAELGSEYNGDNTTHGPIFTWLLDGLIAEWMTNREIERRAA